MWKLDIIIHPGGKGTRSLVSTPKYIELIVFLASDAQYLVSI